MQKPVSDPPDDSGADHLEWQREFEAKRKRVLKAVYVENGLSELARKGADKGKLLSLLVLSCPNNDPEPMRRDVQQRIKSLRSQAKKLEIAASELESTFASDLAFAETWKYLLFPPTFERAPDFTKPRAALNAQCQGIRKLCRALKGEAAILARLAQKYPRLNNRAYVGIVIQHVLNATGHHHFRILASLLTAAHVELGANVDYSEMSLKQTHQRAKPREKHYPFDTSGMLGRGWDNSPSKNR
jgi:hypothetical protein